MTDQSLATRQETGMTRIKNYMLSPEVKSRFTDMMGTGAIYYLNQVLILVANNDELQKCSPKSILISAMRAASLRLSVEPSQGHAWIIPYKGEASFQIGYKGVYELAQRTGLYRFINVIDVYEGEVVEENRMTGMHAITGRRTSDTVIGRMLYFKLNNGFEKTFYMTVEEIAAHAEHYSQGYRNPRSKWHDKIERPKMERKTVLVNGLRKWGRFNSADAELLAAIEEDQVINGRFSEMPEEDRVTVPQQEQRTEQQSMQDMGFDPIKADPQTGEVIEGDVVDSEPEATPLRYQPDQLRTRLAQAAAANSTPLTDGKKGLVVSILESILSFTTDPTASRKQLMVFLVGRDSTKDLRGGEMMALYKWLNPTKDDTSGEWFADPMAAREAVAAFNACQPKQESLL